MDRQQWLTSAEAARVLRVSTASIKRWADEGVLTCERTMGHHRRFSRTTVEEFKKRHGGLVQSPLRAQQSTAQGLGELLGSTSVHALTSWLMGWRAELGSWVAVAQRLEEVVALLHERQVHGAVGWLDGRLAVQGLQRALFHVVDGMPVGPHAPCALLAAAEVDDATWMLCLAELCLREMGWQTLWAGGRVPAAVVACAGHDHVVDAVVLTASIHVRNTEALHAQARLVDRACRIHNRPLVLLGKGSWPAELPHGRRAHAVTDVPQLLQAHPRKVGG